MPIEKKVYHLQDLFDVIYALEIMNTSYTTETVEKTETEGKHWIIRVSS